MSVGVESVLHKIESNPRFMSNVTFRHTIPAQPGIYEPVPEFVPDALRDLLQRKGIEQLYSHQAQAVRAVQEGKDIVVVTPTASGKTLCYNLPVIKTLLEDEEARALYLFPTKALAQDQVAELMAWSDELGGKIKTYTYDGDTPGDARIAIRSAGSIVVTNPDMLHSGILPHHTKWMRLFENLKYVVIDELHIYRGVFGSHVANVLRRLERICRFYGAKPRFICTSATIANPKEHGETLLGRPVSVIDQNGAPRGQKDLIFYNPPVVNKPLGIRRSALLEAEAVAHELIAAKIPTIIFTRSRLNTEVLVTYLRKSFHKLGQPHETIRAYRGGYLPKQRRQIEKDLREGKVLGVVSTNALELGIDIGSLQAAVLTGYPGTIASTWQQLGRAGRTDQPSLAVLVANSSPLNQFIVENPDYFMDRGAEYARINPNNLYILVSHLKCAAFELPFMAGEKFGELDPAEILDYLADQMILRKVENRWYWMSENYPAVDISLRSASTENFAIIDTTDGQTRVIGEVDRFSAPMLIHEGAIYIHESAQYHIDKLDWERQKAYAREVDVDYYTDANLDVELKVLDVFEREELPQVRRSWGEVMVVAKTHMYKKIKFYTHENIGWGQISLPEQELHTTAYWFSIPKENIENLDRGALQSALLGAAHLLGNIASLELMCEPSDLGVTAQIRSPFTEEPTVYIYEKYPGGVGFSEQLFKAHGRLIWRALSIIKKCPCPSGCPSCVGPVEEVGEEGKKHTAWFLKGVLEHGSGQQAEAAPSPAE
ncbi:MAG: DEAD/DEAH box helicase [Bacillota bacterium]|jgi:DEAD/DEAH box helicase domain-containing protein|nr:DEAD/DEAH box helicase [Bacillota bacterium]NLJ02000.1 DEAD/DEAH box helicase [Bacillota bacterium]